MKKLIFLVFTLFSILASTQLVNAQTSLIQFLPSTDGLTDEQSSEFTRISNFSHFVPGSSSLIQFNSLQEVVQGDNLTLCPSLPGLRTQCKNITFSRKHVRYNSEEDFVYYGLFFNEVTSVTECESGVLFLNSRDGRKFGHVEIDEFYFEISAIDSKYSVISLVAPESMLSECVGLEVDETTIQEPQMEAMASDRMAGCEVRVLFLYTSAAATAFTPHMIYDKVASGVSQANTAFLNSFISNGTIKTAAILPLPVPGFVEGNMAVDLQNLKNSSAVAAARAAYTADLVCFITNGGTSYTYSGLTPVGNSPTPMFGLGYFMVEAPYFTMDYTFCHELGHALGCNHQLCIISAPGVGGCTPFVAGAINHGFNWNYGFFKNRGTILNQKAVGSTRILHYSNPAVSYGNNQTGNLSANNATFIGGTICSVSNYFMEPIQQMLNATIVGEESLCKPTIGKYTALINQSIPVTYTWYKSSNGINWGQPIGTSQSYSLNSAYYSVGSTVFLKVIVHDNQGNSASNILDVSILDPSNVNCPRQSSEGTNVPINSWVSANPTFGSSEVNFTLSKSANIEITLTNVFGEVMIDQKAFYEAGEYTLPVPLINYPSGIYFLIGKIGNESFQHKIVRQ